MIWDAAEQDFLRFTPGVPVFLNTIAELSEGTGVWINSTVATAWEQPAFGDPRDVPLLQGFNLVLWTGPSGTAVEDAVVSLGDALDILFTWDATSQEFLRFSPTLPAFLNTATTLNFGDGVWLNVTGRATWEQPASLSVAAAR